MDEEPRQHSDKAMGAVVVFLFVCVLGFVFWMWAAEMAVSDGKQDGNIFTLYDYVERLELKDATLDAEIYRLRNNGLSIRETQAPI